MWCPRRAVALATVVISASACAGVEQDRTGATFGSAVALNGAIAVVGAPGAEVHGVAYVFDARDGEQRLELRPGDAADVKGFGMSVALDGKTAAISACHGHGEAVIYLFDIMNGKQVARIDPGAAAVCGPAPPLALSANTLVIGATGTARNGTDSGALLVFDAMTRQPQRTLTAPEGGAGDLFGIAVALVGRTVLVGSAGSGVRVLDTADGRVLSTLGDGTLSGGRIAVSGTTAIIGASMDDELGMNAGAAHIYNTRSAQRIATLRARDGAALDYFGLSVAISGLKAVVGADSDDHRGRDAGSAYLFNAANGKQMRKLVARDAKDKDHFGRAVAISGNLVIVGSPDDDDHGESSGSVYVFDAVNGKQKAKLMPRAGADTAVRVLPATRRTPANAPEAQRSN